MRRSPLCLDLEGNLCPRLDFSPVSSSWLESLRDKVKHLLAKVPNLHVTACLFNSYKHHTAKHSDFAGGYVLDYFLARSSYFVASCDDMIPIFSINSPQATKQVQNPNYIISSGTEINDYIH